MYTINLKKVFMDMKMQKCKFYKLFQNGLVILNQMEM